MGEREETRMARVGKEGEASWRPGPVFMSLAIRSLALGDTSSHVGTLPRSDLSAALPTDAHLPAACPDMGASKMGSPMTLGARSAGFGRRVGGSDVLVPMATTRVDRLPFGAHWLSRLHTPNVGPLRHQARPCTRPAAARH